MVWITNKIWLFFHKNLMM